MQAFDELGIELLKYGYRKVVFLETECNRCGTFRLGLGPEVPLGDHFECPRCHEQRPCSGILAVGYSRRALPLEPEFYGGAAHFLQISEQEYRPPVRKLGKDGRAHHYKKREHEESEQPWQSQYLMA